MDKLFIKNYIIILLLSMLYSCILLPETFIINRPSWINASDGEFSDKIIITWGKVDNADYYLLYKSTNKIFDYTGPYAVILSNKFFYTNIISNYILYTNILISYYETGFSNNLFISNKIEFYIYTNLLIYETNIRYLSNVIYFEDTNVFLGQKYYYNVRASNVVSNLLSEPVYFYDTGYANEFTVINKWGYFGPSDWILKFPAGLAIDNRGYIYIADITNNRIQKTTLNGIFITNIGGYGTDDGQFVGVRDLAIDSKGNLYAVDTGNYRIQIFDINGNYITNFGKYGTNYGEFVFITCIAIDSFDNIYIGDSYNNVIYKYNQNLELITNIKSNFYGINNIFIDSFNNIYVSDPGNFRVLKINNSGEILLIIGGGKNKTNSGVLDGYFNIPNGIYVDLEGNIFVVDSFNNNIQKFDKDGNFISKFGRYGKNDIEFNKPFDIAVDIYSNIYISDAANNRVQKLRKYILN